jgi:hypothetical protein
MLLMHMHASMLISYSDILAEMESFFPTRVTIEESVVAYPMGVYVDPENIIPCYVDSPITDLYSAQIMLRRLLNKAHAQLYGICTTSPF